MVTDIIKVKNDGTGVIEAVNETERFAEYQKTNRKDALRLRLLAEEMTGLIKNLVGDFDGSFWVEGDKNAASLYLEADCRVDYDRRDALLKVSTTGKNEAHKGFMGKLAGVFEYCLMSYDASAKYSGYYSDYMFDDVPTYGYDRMWSLAAMRDGLNSAPETPAAKEEWDELEKSIVASPADEVTVGVKAHKVRLVIKKTFRFWRKKSRLPARRSGADISTTTTPSRE